MIFFDDLAKHEYEWKEAVGSLAPLKIELKHMTPAEKHELKDAAIKFEKYQSDKETGEISVKTLIDYDKYRDLLIKNKIVRDWQGIAYRPKPDEETGQDVPFTTENFKYFWDNDDRFQDWVYQLTQLNARPEEPSEREKEVKKTFPSGQDGNSGQEI